MPLVDELRKVEQQVDRRLKELEPLVEEYNELRKIAETFGTRISRTQPVSAKKARSRSQSKRNSAQGARGAQKNATASRRTTGRARSAAKARAATNNGFSGKRDAEIVKLVAGQPGITVAQLAGKLGVDPTGLYRAVRRLQSQGHITKQGTGLSSAAQG